MTDLTLRLPATLHQQLAQLSFGRQDKIAQQLDALALVVEDPIIQFKDPDKTLLRQAIATQNLKATIPHLRRYVPQSGVLATDSLTLRTFPIQATGVYKLSAKRSAIGHPPATPVPRRKQLKGQNSVIRGQTVRFRSLPSWLN